MSLSMSAISQPVFIRMLRNLRGLLDKARAHAEATGMDSAVLAGTRLYPNMHPLTTQVQIACDTAKRALSRLTGIEAPAHADTESTLEELQQRIDATLDFISSVPAEKIDGTQDKPVKLELPGMTLDFTGLNYVTGFAIPNFFFHVTTAHAILRHSGVPIGKMDFMGAPPTA